MIDRHDPTGPDEVGATGGSGPGEAALVRRRDASWHDHLSFTVDLVIFTVRDECLQVLLVLRKRKRKDNSNLANRSGVSCIFNKADMPHQAGSNRPIRIRTRKSASLFEQRSVRKSCVVKRTRKWFGRRAIHRPRPWFIPTIDSRKFTKKGPKPLFSCGLWYAFIYNEYNTRKEFLCRASFVCSW